jgi:hypothetical protein
MPVVEEVIEAGNSAVKEAQGVTLVDAVPVDVAVVEILGVSEGLEVVPVDDGVTEPDDAAVEEAEEVTLPDILGVFESVRIAVPVCKNVNEPDDDTLAEDDGV